MRALLVLVAALGLAPSHLGSGDDVAPRDTVSVVDSVSPAFPAGAAVDVVGGDTFLRVRSRGHTVAIDGYDGEPYLRIDRNGNVEENRSSRTWFLNRSRLGGADADFDSVAPARWVTVGTAGTVMWHDHRIHWMGKGTPQTVDDKGTVQHWTVEIVVDGTGHTVSGTLYLKDRAGVQWWSLIGVSALVAAVLLRGPRRRWFSLLTWLSALSVLVGFLQWRDLPSGAQITPLMLVFGGVALVVTNAAMTFQKQAERDPKKRVRSGSVASSLAAGGGATLAVSGILHLDQLRAAYFPMMGPLWPARFTVATMIGVGLAAAIDGALRVVKVGPQES